MRAPVVLPGLAHGVMELPGVLRGWQHAPGRVLGRWVTASALFAAGLLLAVWVVALRSTPDATPIVLPGLHTEPSTAEMWHVLGRNGMVLALHAMACVAGYLAGYSMPREASAYRGLARRVHDAARPAAFAFVAGATIFSLVTQAVVVGGGLRTLSAQLGMSPAVLLAGVLPHALPELIAVFLPLGAWMVAARRQAWGELLGATLVTVAVALPVLLLAATVEVYVTPHLLMALQFV